MKDPSEESRYAVMASELESVRDQRNITFELCAWGFGNVETFGGQMGHLWRTSQDITDTWHGVLWNIDVNDEVNRLENNLRFDIILPKSSHQAICTLDFCEIPRKDFDRSDTGKMGSRDQNSAGITPMASSSARSPLS